MANLRGYIDNCCLDAVNQYALRDEWYRALERQRMPQENARANNPPEAEPSINQLLLLLED